MTPAHRLAWTLAAGGVVVQMAFPFTGGGTLALTLASVGLFAGAAVAHAGATLGWRAAVAVPVLCSGLGLLAEAVGVATGVPFGDYAYSGSLGEQVLGVPLAVPLAWTMMAYPALLVARRLARPGVATVLLAAWALTAWDVFLDPQMVDAGHWRWAHPSPHLPGVEGIPLTNFAGWLLVSLVLCGVLERVLPRVDQPVDRPIDRPADQQPLAIYLWTYASSVLAHTAFFGRPSVALVGGLVMGTVAVPLAVRLWRSRRPVPAPVEVPAVAERWAA